MKTRVFKRLQLSGAAVAVLALISCTQSPTLMTGVRNQSSAAVVGFADVSAKIFQPHCVRCHAQYADYGSVYSEREQILDTIQAGRMPKGGPHLAAAELSLLQSWVQAGSPEAAERQAPLPEPLLPNYGSIAKQILIPRCVICHRPDGQARFLDLSSYAAIVKDRQRSFNGEPLYRPDDPKKSYLIQVIRDPVEPMPPVWSKIPAVTEDQILVLQDWIRADLPE